MIDKDRPAFMLLIADVHGFYGKDFSTFAGNVWWQALGPFDFAAVKDALNKHCVNVDNGQFMPKPADIIRTLEGSTQDTALLAWAKVDRAVRTVGVNSTVVFDDALIHAVIDDMGGWTPLGSKPEEEWPFVRNEFVNRYRGYRSRQVTPAYPRTLIGRFEAQNSQQGFKSEPPTLIGDPTLAQRVMLAGSNAPRLQITQAGQALQLLQ